MAATFNLDIFDCITEGFERATGGARELRTGNDYRTARRSLNLLLMEWANRGLNLWTLEQGTIPLVAGVASYQLPADTVDIIEFYLREEGDGRQSDQSITRMSVSTYASINNKLQQGRPQQVYVQRAAPHPSVTFWPVPDTNDLIFVGWRLRRIGDAGEPGSGTVDVPFRFLPALISGLAYYIAQKLPEGEHRLQALKQEYEMQYEIAATEDRERAAVKLIPRIR
jgi:hypothetical protein